MQHTITFAANLTGQTITLGPAQNRQQLKLERNVFIDGAAQGITIQRDPSTTVKYRLFEVDANVTAKLKGLTLRKGEVDSNVGGAVWSKGNLTLENCVLVQNKAIDSRGGAVAATAGSLTASGCTFTGNSAMRGGAVFIEERVTTTISSSSLVLNNATASGVTPSAHGGGIYISSSTTAAATTVTLNAVDVNGNLALTAGGGIYVSNPGEAGAGTTLTLNATIVQNNSVTSTAGKGGGIYFGKGTIVFATATIRDNSATQGDGMYRVTGTTVELGPGGVSYENDQEFVGP